VSFPKLEKRIRTSVGSAGRGGAWEEGLFTNNNEVVISSDCAPFERKERGGGVGLVNKAGADEPPNLVPTGDLPKKVEAHERLLRERT